MKIGYARVSTKGQNLDLQLEALKNAGCEKIFQEKISGAKKSRPEFDKMLQMLREGDTVVVWKMSRLGRSLSHMISLFEQFEKDKISIQTLSPAMTVDYSPTGRLIRNFFAMLAEFQRDIIRENTKAGLAVARAKGRVGGRPKGMSPNAIEKAWRIHRLHKLNDMSVREIMKFTDVKSTSTYYKYLKFVLQHEQQQKEAEREEQKNAKKRSI